ncbi:hypothetical protein [Halorussus caseinilyticus]|uniref:Uncharacterized protein n=1 Tax=Halorussus caseinilyticus TaxID=3034025 RepID=A0ABD5WQV7_9EURY
MTERIDLDELDAGDADESAASSGADPDPMPRVPRENEDKPVGVLPSPAARAQVRATPMRPARPHRARRTQTDVLARARAKHNIVLRSRPRDLTAATRPT